MPGECRGRNRGNCISQSCGSCTSHAVIAKRINNGTFDILLISFVFLLLSFALLTSLLPSFAQAAPFGPNSINASTPQTYDDNLSARVVAAYAGNVTQLIINDTKVTRRWQGYFGNLTGEVVLSDANNNSLYRWQLFPSGEVYAANSSSISWDKIGCVNFTGNLSGKGDDLYEPFNITTLERFFNAGTNDVDGIDETFNNTYLNSTGFMTGSVLINDQNKCPLAYTFVSNAYQASEFEEVILTDNSSIIFTTLLERGAIGFDARKWDFQMLVAENGDDPTPTNYYFYVEVS